MNTVEDVNETALHKACWQGSTECVKELLAHGADTSIKNKCGKTPLDIAKEEKNQAVIDFLMKHKKRREQYLMDSILSEVSTLKAQDVERVESAC